MHHLYRVFFFFFFGGIKVRLWEFLTKTVMQKRCETSICFAIVKQILSSADFFPCRIYRLTLLFKRRRSEMLPWDLSIPFVDDFPLFSCRQTYLINVCIAHNYIQWSNKRFISGLAMIWFVTSLLRKMKLACQFSRFRLTLFLMTQLL